MTSVFIIGTGWLGLPLAKKLISDNLTVHATKTTQEGASKISALGVPCHPFQFDSVNPTASIQSLVSLLRQHRCDVIIGSFPPGFRKGSGEEYAQYWQQVTDAAQQASVSKVIMVSSTTVYPNIAETLNEEQASYAISQSNDKFSDNAKIMLQAEQYVIDSGLDYAVVRCSGLVGPDRHPSRFASKLKQVSTVAPANMLHLEDAVGIVSFALTNISRQVVNATTPNTVSKAHYYQAALDCVNSKETLPPTNDIPDKKISASKILEFGYQFHFQSTLDALND
ncbi:NAD-dependent epimerase/dehydratase family protein [Vibrio sp. T187]|uniref:NAD(P)H-binding protein n=1 Tax=Vibrio TaxID=662 RepID=UPI0010C9B8DA|nr:MULTISPECIES: NAD(P)H-binding protein [Vibrio]MBW3694663.1 NAD-dependent epimerase/dehydratase family protein [Vibrio sp. T187]